jgi:glycosyltransferase domain-containing protein
MANPLVSIGIPTFNRALQLKECLIRLRLQTYPNLEIIVSDNATPGTEVSNILAEEAKDNLHLRYFIQNENIEAEPNFNYVFQKAKGKYFIWLSDDDYFSDNYIDECVSFLERNPDYSACAGMPKYLSDEQIVFSEQGFSLEQNFKMFRILKYFAKVRKNGIFYSVFRKEDVSNEPIARNIGSDWCHVAGLALAGKIKMLPQISVYRSLDGGSATRARMAKRWQLNSIQTIFFETYTAWQLCTTLFDDSKRKKHYGSITQMVIQIFLFLFLNAKFLYNSLCHRMGISLKN